MRPPESPVFIKATTQAIAAQYMRPWRCDFDAVVVVNGGGDIAFGCRSRTQGHLTKSHKRKYQSEGGLQVFSTK